MELMRRRRGVMGLNGGGIPIIAATATGNPLSFITDMVRPLKSLVIPFTPIQAAGTPSPDNILPISGWTGCNITQAGKNLYNANALRYGYYTAGGDYNVDNNLRSTQLIRVTGSNIAISWGTVVGSLVYLRTSFFDKDKVFIERHSPDNSPLSSNGYRIETCPSGTEYIVITFEHSQKNCVNNDKFQIELGSTVTTYEAYHVTALPITFTNPSTGDPLTVYGGTVTLNEDGSADVVDSRIIVTYDGDEDWGKSGAYYYVRTSSSYNVQQVPVSNLFLGVSNRRFQDLADLEFAMTQNDMSYINIRYDAMTSLDAFKELLSNTPMIVAYERKYPITYHFDNVGQLITFVGTNTIWTDTNDTNTATYLKHQS